MIVLHVWDRDERVFPFRGPVRFEGLEEAALRGLSRAPGLVSFEFLAGRIEAPGTRVNREVFRRAAGREVLCRDSARSRRDLF